MYPVAFLSVVCAGGVFSLSPPNLLPSDVAYQMKVVGANVVFCSQDLLTSAEKACQLTGVPLSKLYVVSSTGKHDIFNATSALSLLGPSALPSVKITDLKALQTTTLAIYFTSGTSGMPKYT